MASTLDNVLDQVGDLSSDDLLILLERVTHELRQKNLSQQLSQTAQTKNTLREEPKIYRLTPEEARQGLDLIFTPEELAEIAKTDFSNQPPLPKSLAEMISEDREDRL